MPRKYSTNYGRKGDLSIFIEDRFSGLEISAGGNDTQEYEEKAVFRSAGASSQQLLQWLLLQGFTARKQRQRAWSTADPTLGKEGGSGRSGNTCPVEKARF